LVSKGYQVNINFYPWARSQMLVEQGRIDILFPEYVIDESALSNVIKNTKRHELLTLTDAFPGGKISLVTHKDNLENNLGDLSLIHHKIVGVVRGYTNSEEIDAMIHKEQFSVVEAVNELQLMKLLVAKRVDFIVGDKKVFTHTVESSNLPMLRKQRLFKNIKYLQPALTQHALFYALSNKNPQHKSLLRDINSALASFKQLGLTKQFIHDKTQCNRQKGPLRLI
jgi:polar amino acid transport system substrate-binding protein